MSDNISLKKLLLPEGAKSEQYLKANLNVHPYLQTSKNDVLESPVWMLMASQFYNEDSIKKNMKNGDINQEFTDFIVDLSRYQGNSIHNKFNEKIYNNVYLNWNNIDQETRNFYDTFLGLYKVNSNNEDVLVESYESLPNNLNNENNYKMKFNMNGGSTQFGKLIPSLPVESSKIWYTNSEGKIVSDDKQSTNDLKSIYTCLFMNEDSNICNKYGLKLPIMAGGSNEGFNIDIYEAVKPYLDRSHELSVYENLEGGRSVLDNELNFNNYFLLSVLNQNDRNVSSCVNLLKSNNLDSSGKVDVELASDTLDKLGFEKKDKTFESVSSWKNKVEDNIKNNELIDMINNESNISVLSHLGKIVNYVNYNNNMNQEPQILQSTNNKSIEDLGLNTDWISDFVKKQTFDSVKNLDIEKFYNDIETNGFSNQTGGSHIIPFPFVHPLGKNKDRRDERFERLKPRFMGPVTPGLLPHPYLGGPFPGSPGIAPFPVAPGLAPFPGTPGPIMKTWPGSEQGPPGLFHRFLFGIPFGIGPWFRRSFKGITRDELDERLRRDSTLYRRALGASKDLKSEIKGYGVDIGDFNNIVDGIITECKDNSNVGCVRGMLHLLIGIAKVSHILKKKHPEALREPDKKREVKEGFNRVATNINREGNINNKWARLGDMKRDIFSNWDRIKNQIENYKPEDGEPSGEVMLQHLIGQTV